MKTKITAYLKPKTASLGFNNQELEGIIDTVASNLTLKEGATEEEVNAAIKAHCNTLIPILQTAKKILPPIIEQYIHDNPPPPPLITHTPLPRSKDEIAQALNISRTTLTAWIRPIEHKLLPLGYKQQKILTPAMLRIIYHHLVIQEDIFEEREQSIKRSL